MASNLLSVVSNLLTSLSKSTPSTLTLIALLLISIPVVHSFVTYDKRRKFLPPGPKGYPLIGNLLAFSNPDKIPQIVSGWAKEYGPIMYSRMGASDWIYINSPVVAKELMDKRGSKYSDRPWMPMAFDATSNRNRIIFMPYGDTWRRLRSISQSALSITTSATYKPIQDFESKQVLYEFLHAQDDEAFFDINRRYSTSAIMTATYGHRVADWNDPVISRVYKVLEHFSQMAEPGAWLVDSFPLLAKLPSRMVQNWWNIGREWFEYDSKVYLDLYLDLVEKVRKGTAPDCFIRDVYERIQQSPEKHAISDELAAYAAGSLVEAGSESTSTVINAWIMACQLFPDVVGPAQEELDRVVGPERMPTFDDEDKLPYIRAMVKETLRWWPITKPGMPHSVTEDDWYEGYFIPKGTVVAINWWAIHYDENRWGNAHIYDPSRYLSDPHTTAECVNLADATKRDHYAYGSGRRICTGMHLAQNSLFINMARTLWAFNIKRAKGPDGEEVEPVVQSQPGFIHTPAKFKAVLEPRSERHAEIVERDWLTAKESGVSWSRKKTFQTAR